jgi:hypothetical protein
MNVENCVGLMLGCPKLREYHCRNPFLPPSYTAGEYSGPQQVEVFPFMERMSWDFGLADWDMVLMGSVQLPSLKEMAWRQHPHIRGDVFTKSLKGPSYLSLRSQFMSQLQTLAVFECSLQLWSIRELCAALPNTLRELHLIGEHMQAEVVDCFHKLTFRGDDPESSFFPWLQVLSMPHIQNCPEPGVLLNSLLGMLCSRRNEPQTANWKPSVPIRQLRFSVAASQTAGWDPAQFQRFEQFVQMGLRFELVNGRASSVTSLSRDPG